MEKDLPVAVEDIEDEFYREFVVNSGWVTRVFFCVPDSRVSWYNAFHTISAV